MSAVPSSTPAPAQSNKLASSLRWIAGGGAAAAALAALTIAVWPASEVDKARSDGEQFGEAVAQLQAADTTAEVDARSSRSRTRPPTRASTAPTP